MASKRLLGTDGADWRWVCAALVLIGVLQATAPTMADVKTFDRCGSGLRRNCVVDGDTFWLGREKIRLFNVDAPELSEPRCKSERQLAETATERLSQLLGAGDVQVDRHGTDRYGRTLALVSAGGVDVGEQLVDEGLARIWEGRRKPWCK